MLRRWSRIEPGAGRKLRGLRRIERVGRRNLQQQNYIERSDTMPVIQST
jgi:hypothetical protein